jgi:tRNA (guanine9-N1)-methyltransferase
LNKAIQSNIRTARLPIGRFLASLTTRKVLTVNQVFEILVKWVETRDWEKALYSVIPKRKFVDGGNTQKDDDGEEELDDERVDEDLEGSRGKAEIIECVGSERQNAS